MEVSDSSYLYFKCLKGLKERKVDRPEYRSRLDYEFSVITKMNFPGYFLVVSDFTSWARSQDIPTGCGRGSAGGSLIAYLLGITDIDSVKHNLPFERFLNEHRVSMPDIDSDFSQRRREEVFQYLVRKFGRDEVCSIGTVGTLKAKSALKDTCKTLGIPYATSELFAALIPDEIRGGEGDYEVTINLCLHPTPGFRKHYENAIKDFTHAYEVNPQFKRAVDLANSIESLPKSEGGHPAGVIISPRPLWLDIPLRADKTGEKAISQWTDKQVEKMGFVKFDLLGLRTLDVIDDAMKSIHARTGRQIIWDDIDYKDPLTHALVSSGKTLGVFQLEETGIANLCSQFKPTSLEDLSMIIALYRPGPLDSGMDKMAIDVRKTGVVPVYPIKKMNEVLASTYGILIYQEQVMSLAKELSGYTLAEADLLRRAMGKKSPAEMAKLKDQFVKGGMDRGASEKDITDVFQMIDRFSAYGFNQAHSLSYAINAFRTAYLKAHYPADFYAAEVSSYDDTKKIVKALADAEEFNIRLVPPDVNRSAASFYPVDEFAIAFSLSAIKGLGDSGVSDILNARKSGQFKDLPDFISRVKVKKNNLEALARSGAFDSLEPAMNRLEIEEYAAMLSVAYESHQKDKATGQMNIFEMIQGSTTLPFVSKPVIPNSPSLILENEFSYLGLCLSGSPFDKFKIIREKRVITNIEDIKKTKANVTILGKIDKVVVKKGAKGTFAFVSVSDETGMISVKYWSESFLDYSHLLIEGSFVVITGKVNEYKGLELSCVSMAFASDEVERLFDKIVLKSLSYDALLYISKLPIGNIPIYLEPPNSRKRIKLGTFDVSYESFPYKET